MSQNNAKISSMMKIIKITPLYFSAIFMASLLVSGCTTNSPKTNPTTQEYNLPVETEVQENIETSIDTGMVESDATDSGTEVSPEKVENSFEACSKTYYDRCYINNPKTINQQRCLQGMKITVNINCPDTPYGTKK